MRREPSGPWPCPPPWTIIHLRARCAVGAWVKRPVFPHKSRSPRDQDATSTDRRAGVSLRTLTLNEFVSLRVHRVRNHKKKLNPPPPLPQNCSGGPCAQHIKVPSISDRGFTSRERVHSHRSRRREHCSRRREYRTQSYITASKHLPEVPKLHSMHTSHKGRMLASITLDLNSPGSNICQAKVAGHGTR